SGGGTMLCEPGRTITYSLYVPESLVEGITFRKSYALLDDWAVRAFVEMGIPASYREINDIISPRGKIAGAAQARRRGLVLHHTTIAHAMDVELLPRLIRIGRPAIAGTGVRSADKSVSPLSWFTSLTCAEVARNLQRYFSNELRGHSSEVTPGELEAAGHLVSSKYGTPAWINRLP
ncbi:MAG TPA: lipoate--protein ligase family protein, partial [Candidatus Dormibacteraeota bacterium]